MMTTVDKLAAALRACLPHVTVDAVEPDIQKASRAADTAARAALAEHDATQAAPVTTPRLFLSASVRRGLEAIGAGMLDHDCPDQRAAIAWARGLSESITAPAAQSRRVSRANAASAKRERKINQS